MAVNNQLKLTVYAASASDVPDEIKALSPNIQIIKYDDGENLLYKPLIFPQIVLCLTSQGKISAMEIAQTLRMIMPDVPMYYISVDPKEFDRKGLIKNGFNDAYLLPWEKAELTRSMKDEILYTVISEMRDYRPIKVLDLIPGTIMKFNTKIHLPFNKKFLLFAREGEAVTQIKLNNLHEHKQNTLYVHKNDMMKFYEYTIEAFKQIGRSGGNETQKQQRLKTSIREFVSDMFIEDDDHSFKKSFEVLEDLKKIVFSLVEEENPKIILRIDNLIHQEIDFYEHLTRVATYTVIFAIALDIDKPFELGLAGLLHDIGLTALPAEVMSVPYAEMGPEMKKAYDQHPQLSIDIIRLKKMMVSDRVQKAILYHHERMDGTGTPDKLEGKRITIEGQIVAMANQFDNLTCIKPNQPRLTPKDAFEELLKENSSDPFKMGVSIDIIKKLKQAYLKGSIK